MAVRLFVGNLPYSATEADLREYFSAVAPPTSIAVPVDRETGRPRGFAFVEFATPEQGQEAIRRFNAQPYQGRPLSVSEARAREDRGPRPAGPGGPRPGGFGGPRPGGGGFAPRAPRPFDAGAMPGAPSRDRATGPNRSFGPDAKPKRGAKYQQRSEKPRGPIREKNTGRVYSVDAFGEEETGEELTEFDDIASTAEKTDEEEGNE